MLRHVNVDLSRKYKISGKSKAKRRSVSSVLTLWDIQNRGRFTALWGDQTRLAMAANPKGPRDRYAGTPATHLQAIAIT